MTEEYAGEGWEVYPAFITTELVDQPRVPISGERIVVALGTDEKTGLPLELSISLKKRPDNSVVMYAIKEPVGVPLPFSRLIIEEGRVPNVRRITIQYDD